MMNATILDLRSTTAEVATRNYRHKVVVEHNRDYITLLTTLVDTAFAVKYL